jgi:hypothetical protein
VLEKGRFSRWSGVALLRVDAIDPAAPINHFQLDYSPWASVESWARLGRWPNATCD